MTTEGDHGLHLDCSLSWETRFSERDALFAARPYSPNSHPGNANNIDSLFKRFEMRTPATPSNDQLLMLLTVAEAGSSTAAAGRQGCATSAINYAIDTLEEQLGISLLDRGTTDKPKLPQQDGAVVSEARAVELHFDYSVSLGDFVFRTRCSTRVTSRHLSVRSPIRSRLMRPRSLRTTPQPTISPRKTGDTSATTDKPLCRPGTPDRKPDGSLPRLPSIRTAPYSDTIHLD